MNDYTCGYGSSSSASKMSSENLIHFKKTIKQPTERIPLASTKTLTSANRKKNYKLTRIAALPSDIASLMIRYF